MDDSFDRAGIDRPLAEQFLDEWTHALSPRAAEELAAFHVSDELQDRLDEYGRRASEGELSRSQQADLERLSGLNSSIALLVLGARRRARREVTPAAPPPVAAAARPAETTDAV